MQYKLRALFVIQLGFALTIGFVLWATTEYRRQRGIRLHLNAIGATWVGFQTTNDKFEVNVCFGGAISGELDAENEFGFVEFKLATLNSQSLAKLAIPRRVSDLRFVNCTLQDEDLDPLENVPGLTAILLWNTPISDRAIDRIARVPRLKKVILKSTPITPEGIERLKMARPEIEIVYLP